MISSVWGGTIIEAWSPLSVSKTCESDSTTDYLPTKYKHNNNNNDEYNKLNKNKNKEIIAMNVDYRSNKLQEDVNPNAYTVLYNNMIVPFKRLKLTGIDIQ